VVTDGSGGSRPVVQFDRGDFVRSDFAHNLQAVSSPTTNDTDGVDTLRFIVIDFFLNFWNVVVVVVVNLYELIGNLVRWW